MSTALQRFARSEVEAHVDENSLWIILDNKVYDVTKVGWFFFSYFEFHY